MPLIAKREKLATFNKQNILDAAKRLFAAHGIAHTTMDDIARAAESSKSTLYVYFESKEEIYNHIIYEHMVILREGLGSAVRAANGFEEGYYAVCETLVAFQKEYPLYFESLLDEIPVDEEAFERQPILKKIYDIGEETNALVLGFIQGGISQGYLRSDIDPLPTVFVLLASLNGIISLAEKKAKYMRRDFNMERPDFLACGFDLLLRSIRADCS